MYGEVVKGRSFRASFYRANQVQRCRRPIMG